MTIPRAYLQNPAQDVIPVTKSASPLPEGQCKALLIGTGGTLNITTPGFDGVPKERDSLPVEAGLYPFRCSHVREGGTADNIFAIY